MNSKALGLTHALSFDIEDWFHIVEIEALSNTDDWDSMPSLVERYTNEILEICEIANVKATFFMLGWIAEHHPQVVRSIADAGHEIGTHSHWHRRVYDLTPDEFREDMIQSISSIESAAGVKVEGFRAPSFSITPGTEWAIDILHELGILYDASLFPALRAHGGYSCHKKAHFFNKAPSERPIAELPMSIMKIGPFETAFSGGGYLRFLPLRIIEKGIRQLGKEGIPTVVYLHPRDFAPDCPRVPMPLKRRFKCYTGMKTTAPKLKYLLNKYKWGTCKEVLMEQLGSSWTKCE